MRNPEHLVQCAEILRRAAQQRTHLYSTVKDPTRRMQWLTPVRMEWERWTAEGSRVDCDV